MRTLYIADKKTWEQNTLLLHESHWIPTDDPAKILVVCSFSHDGNADSWEGLIGVETLPHPFAGQSQAIKDSHAAILSRIGVKKGDTVVDVARLASKFHGSFRPERL